MKTFDLSFLEQVGVSSTEKYKKCPWLKSDFEDSIWNFDFGKEKLKVDFNVEMSDGQNLTSKHHNKTLLTIKYWLLCNTHPDNSKGVQLAAKSVHANTVCLLHLLDYFLLFDKDLHISSCGFSALNENAVRQLFFAICQSNKINESLYEYYDRLGSYLVFQALNSDGSELEQEIAESKYDLKAISDEQIEYNKFNISLDNIPLVRAWLLKNKFYRRASTRDKYELVVNRKALSRVIFKNTFVGKFISQISVDILNLGERDPSQREMEAVSVTHPNSTIGKTKFLSYKSVFKSLRILYCNDLYKEKLLLPPIEILQEVDLVDPDYSNYKRFKTLPSSIVFQSIRNAIEFHLEFGSELITSYENLINKISKIDFDPNVRFSRSNLTHAQFMDSLTPKIRGLGVNCWSISRNRESTKSNLDFYSAFRSNRGLLNLIQVYVGSVKVVVGALSARRQSELMSLKSGKCVDNTGRYLVFERSKSSQGLYGLRKTIARPIEGIAVDMIRQVERVSLILKKYGFVKDINLVFDSIANGSPVEMLLDVSKGQYNRDIDCFCDYFETPTFNGARYYIRQHQLRRFFAMSFFWGNGFGSLDTLRWFLGHTDPEHLYHYITEATQGSVLKDVKVQYATEVINENKGLVNLVQERFHTDDYTILETEELEEYIEELIDSGDVEIEPEFFEDDDGKKYKIVVKVKGGTL